MVGENKFEVKSEKKIDFSLLCIIFVVLLQLLLNKQEQNESERFCIFFLFLLLL